MSVAHDSALFRCRAANPRRAAVFGFGATGVVNPRRDLEGAQAGSGAPFGVVSVREGRGLHEGPAIVLELPAGEALTDHQVHERAWVTVIEGKVEITTTAGEQVCGGTGLVVEFAPREASRRARSLECSDPAPADLLARHRHPGARRSRTRHMPGSTPLSISTQQRSRP